MGLSAQATLIYADSIFLNASCSIIDEGGPAYIWTSNFAMVQGQSPLSPQPVNGTTAPADLSATLQSISFGTSIGRPSSASLTTEDLATMFSPPEVAAGSFVWLGAPDSDLQIAGADIIEAAFMARDPETLQIFEPDPDTSD